MNRFGVYPLEEVERRLRADAKERVERLRKYYEQEIGETATEYEKKIQRVIHHRQALMSLDGAGLPVYAYGRGEEVTVDLGLFKNTRADRRKLADQIRAIRVALDCQVKYVGKDLAHDEKSIEFTSHPVDFQMVRVVFRRPLPKNKPGAKCRVVTEKRTVRRLVCDV